MPIIILLPKSWEGTILVLIQANYLKIQPINKN